MEQWKQIQEHPMYSVSNKGRVRNDNSGRILRQGKEKCGYLHVVLFPNRKVCRVHRLVAEAFIDNPDNKVDVNHKDLNKQNNILDNLEWTTRKENCQHAQKSGLYKVKMDVQSVKQLRLRAKTMRKLNYAQLAREFNISSSTVRSIVLRLIWAHI